MRRIQVHFKPTLLLRTIQITIVAILFFLIYYGAKQIDTSGEGRFLLEGILAILGTILFVLFFLKSDIILSPKRYLTMDSNGLSIKNKKGIGEEYFWKDISKVILFFKGVRFYQVLLFNDGQEIEFEFSEMWFFSAFNSSKGLKYNHNKLMNYFGGIREFTERIDVQHYNELLAEFELPSPGWFGKETS